MGDFDIQNAYLLGCVKITKVKRHYSPVQTSRRQHSCEYSVRGDDLCSILVCKVAFLRIHGVSNGRLSRVLKAMQSEGGTPQRDQRGRHPPANKTSEEIIAAVKEHIESFPKYKSHYSRSDNPHREYLSPELTIAKMYTLYKESCNEKGITEMAKEWMYRKVFNESYNLHFGQ